MIRDLSRLIWYSLITVRFLLKDHRLAFVVSIMDTGKQLEDQYRRFLHTIQQRFHQAMDCLRAYVNQCPPLAATLFAFVLLSIVPVAVYILFATLSAGVSLSVAVIGFLLVEGTLLLAGAGVLLTVLGSIAAVAGVGCSWLIVLWAAYRAGAYLVGRLQYNTAGLSQTAQKLPQHLKSEASTAATSASG